MISTVIFIFFVFAFFAAAEVFLCLFVYNDAKEHSDIPALWVVLVLFVPNFIGLLLYLLIGRKPAVICPSCRAVIQSTSKFCPDCGHETVGVKHAGLSSRSKVRLIAFVAFMILFIISIVVMSIFFFYQ